VLSGNWKLKGRCSECQRNPNLKDAWGCEGKTTMDVPVVREITGGIEYRYWSCPVNFIPLSIWKFYDLYKFHKDFPSAPFPSYKKVSPRFWAACKFLESKLSEQEAEKAKG